MSSTVLSGRYRLESKLGSGGMSTVYLALDEVLDRPVAIKLLHREISEEADQLERFRREARAAARLSHPNLVGVIDAGEDDGRPYIVFEYIEGRTLKRRMQEEGRLPVDEAVAYGIEIGRGLTAAHARKLVHRDVKPQNVLIDPDGRAKVTDFGIARSLEQKGMTATGRVLGTTDYVSPEQAMGEDVDERSDVYSLGVVLYEMLTGDVPFQAETQVGVAMKHVNEPMPDVQARRPEVSASVAAVVDRSTTKDPRDRYSTVAEMVRDLEQTLEVEAARRGGTSGEATSVLDSVPDDRRRLGGRRRISGAGIALAVVIIALAAAAVIFATRLDLGGGETAQGGGGTTEVKLSNDAASEFDPEGDERETGTQQLAVDGNPTGTA
ncbi:MAG TPA: protein kinase, partial [Solirubrobacterales bacterium]|nr:protein kinase [Solirubrobacterales bacterium]